MSNDIDLASFMSQYAFVHKHGLRESSEACQEILTSCYWSDLWFNGESNQVIADRLLSLFKPFSEVSLLEVFSEDPCTHLIKIISRSMGRIAQNETNLLSLIWEHACEHDHRFLKELVAVLCSEKEHRFYYQQAWCLPPEELEQQMEIIQSSLRLRRLVGCL